MVVIDNIKLFMMNISLGVGAGGKHQCHDIDSSIFLVWWTLKNYELVKHAS
jgi:hypothetical protein